ncbi:hypothetical protein niasHT_012298 [Heterodera trifolii]|uniref:Uncharacterized protein n=1 Tax=Heterodera trifolii TaxID=157864 RepID=A0ABD2LDX0_9BILA
MSQQLALIMFVIALQIGFAEGGFFSAVTDFFDNVGQTIEKAWNDVKEPLLDAGALYLAPLSSIVEVVTLSGFAKMIANPDRIAKEFACGPNTNAIFKGAAKFQIEFALGCEQKREVKRQCDGERDSCYSVCGNKQEHCSSVHEKCFKKRDRVDCHGVDKLDPTTDMVRYVGMQVKACKEQKKTFKQIPSDELEKPENGQMEKNVGKNFSDVPPNATTTALTAVPMP